MMMVKMTMMLPMLVMMMILMLLMVIHCSMMFANFFWQH